MPTACHPSTRPGLPRLPDTGADFIHFAADLHLGEDTPAITAGFLAYLDRLPDLAGSLYLLGDVFEVWIGDDDLDAPAHQAVVTALAAATARGLKLHVQHGNRDFLLGEGFARRTGAQLIPDPYVLSLPAWQFVLSHGDALCTADTAYQAFRAQVRQPEWARQFLAQPLAIRREIARKLRQDSEQAKGDKRLTTASGYGVMDLAPAATEDFLRDHGYATMIHGHTHLPATHDHIVDGIHVERWVLADWREEQMEILEWNGENLRRRPIQELLAPSPS